MTDKTQVHAAGQVELQFSAQNSRNQYIRLGVDDELYDRLRGMEKNFFFMTLVLTDENGKYIPTFEPGDDEQPADPSEPEQTGGQFVRDLLHCGIFNRHDVLEKIGSDKGFQAWVREQPSCISKQSPCVYAHVRRANNSGVGIKPEYSGVPLTDEEHKLQHQKGEAALLESRLSWPISPSAAKDWFDKKAAWYRWQWASTAIAYVFLDQDSRSDVSPHAWRSWFASHDIELPRNLL